MAMYQALGEAAEGRRRAVRRANTKIGQEPTITAPGAALGLTITATELALGVLASFDDADRAAIWGG
jgi:hypothetical protein